jgi:hypothetical protein
MKKIILLIIATMLFMSPFVAATTMTTLDKAQVLKTMQSTNLRFTHSVFVEEATTTWCPNCPNAAEALYSLYNNSEYSMYFVAFVSDMNSVAQDRNWGHYRARAIPTIFIDGGFSNYVGSGSTPLQTEQVYRPLIEEAGARTVHPLELETSVVGHGDATLDIAISVKNTGSKPYLGYVRSYVTEIISRWNNQQKDPYHFGFLDYAIESMIFLAPQNSRTFTITWDGAANHGTLTYPDIVDDNIMVITAVAHWMPHLVAQEEYVGTHFAYYVDQSDGALVE